MARAVNYVWNFCNESQRSCLRLGKRWLSGFDLTSLTAGSSKEVGLPAESIRAVCLQYAQSRREKKRPYLRWRSRRSLGWVPFKRRDIKMFGDKVLYFGMNYKISNSRPFPDGATIRDGGSFSEDALGRWYINIVLDVPTIHLPHSQDAVGIDLGLKNLATLSTGDVIPNEREYRRLESALGISQRAGKKRRSRAISAKIANRRRDRLHKSSTDIVRRFGNIFVGDASPKALARTRMAKSINDASWASFKEMLRYKSDYAGRVYLEVNESYSTQACSRCGCLPNGRPRGIAGLGIREWDCGDCGAHHDRDINAAANILRSGHGSLAEGVAAV